MNAHTKKYISSKQYRSMGKFSVTTPDRSTVDLEKTFALDGAASVLNSERRNKNNESSFSQEIATLNKARPSKTMQITEENISEAQNNTGNTETTEVVSIPAISPEAIQLINALMHTQNHIVQELTDVFDKRLEKFDDIIMDLIRCKTENERLKQKVDNLTRDNYKLKKEVESYKSVLPGLYVRKELDKTRF